VSYFSWRFNQWADTQHGGVCGMPLIGIWGLGVLIMGFLSLVALGVGTAAFVRLPAHKQRRRLAELLLLAFPFLMASSVIASAILWA
jgi:ABC-type multidrug transport system permease subunit